MTGLTSVHEKPADTPPPVEWRSVSLKPADVGEFHKLAHKYTGGAGLLERHGTGWNGIREMRRLDADLDELDLEGSRDCRLSKLPETNRRPRLPPACTVVAGDNRNDRRSNHAQRVSDRQADGPDGHTELVRRYYDNNTAVFEQVGQGGGSIHRAVWGPGVSTRAQAFHYVDELILRALPQKVTTPVVVDLGCGLGASLLYLAGRTDLTGEGITISRVQAERATRLIAEAGAADRILCREGNYLSIPDDLAGIVDLAFSIEAFVHGPDAGGFFREAARTLRPGGRLVICDDFLAGSAASVSSRAARRLAEFRTGWRIGSLHTVEHVRDLASANGLTLVDDLDLTPHLELRRPRDRWIGLLVAAGRPFRLSGDYWQSLVGGNALQWCLLHGALRYRLLRFERTA